MRRALGAVNTVVFSDGRRVGHNTDWWGFAESFKLGLQGANLQRVVQLGAGGAGAAVAYAMLKLGAQRLGCLRHRYSQDASAGSLCCRNCFHRERLPLSPTCGPRWPQPMA